MSVEIFAKEHKTFQEIWEKVDRSFREALNKTKNEIDLKDVQIFPIKTQGFEFDRAYTWKSDEIIRVIEVSYGDNNHLEFCVQVYKKDDSITLRDGVPNHPNVQKVRLKIFDTNEVATDLKDGQNNEPIVDAFIKALIEAQNTKDSDLIDKGYLA